MCNDGLCQVHAMLDEVVMGGQVLETNIEDVLKSIVEIQRQALYWQGKTNSLKGGWTWGLPRKKKAEGMDFIWEDFWL